MSMWTYKDAITERGWMPGSAADNGLTVGQSSDGK